MSRVDVTLAVPTWNGGAQFQELLLRSIELRPRPAAMVAFDSESTDGTPERAREAGWQVTSIPRSSFDHGLTRQRMAEEAKTSLVAYLSQDAIPDPDYLRPLVAALEDPRTAAASARVLPRSGASPLTRRTVLASPQASELAACFDCDPEAFARLDAAERRTLCRLDNVASIYRREALLRHPFPKTMMGEDVAFAANAIAAGLRIRFVPEAVVRHSHEYGAITAFRRFRDDAAFVRREFRLAVRPSLASVVRGIGYEVVEDYRFLTKEPRVSRLDAIAIAVTRGAWRRAGQVFGQWWGSIGAPTT